MSMLLMANILLTANPTTTVLTGIDAMAASASTVLPILLATMKTSLSPSLRSTFLPPSLLPTASRAVTVLATSDATRVSASIVAPLLLASATKTMSLSVMLRASSPPGVVLTADTITSASASKSVSKVTACTMISSARTLDITIKDHINHGDDEDK